MKQQIYRRLFVLFVLLGGFLFALSDVEAQQEAEWVILEIDAPVMQVMVDYFSRGIQFAEDEGADGVLVILDTPGGEISQMMEVVGLFRNAKIPIVVYIMPAGAQAASAGSVITMAGHASGMAPETVIGAASPVDGSGLDIEETMYRKVTEDLKATVRSLTERRGEEAVALAEAMIDEAKAVHADEALAAGLIDVVAVDIDDLWRQLDGLVVIVGQEEVTLRTLNPVEKRVEISFLEQLLLALTNPILLGILLTIGVQAILFELSNPGGWIAGFIGIVCLGLALYGAGQLPVNWFGLGLIIVAFVLFILEVKAVTHGALAAVGTITMLVGLLVLFNSAGAPEFARLSFWWALAITLPTAAFFLFLVTMVLRTYNKRPLTGEEGLLGEKGVARSDFKQNGVQYWGTVLVLGEIWQAVADEPIAKGAFVTIVSREKFRLTVRSGDSI